jgi:drug/metabolite transporter (DMT)-like permease
VPFPHAGEICALLAPLCWAVAVILYRKTAGISALSMNLFKNCVAIVLLTFTLLALGIALPTDRPLGDWVRLVLSGLVGLAVADTLLFEGLRRVGAARVAVVDTVYAPLMILMAWAFLAEEPGPMFLLGGAAVIVGVGIATIDPSGASVRGDRSVLVGMLYAFGAIVGTAVGVVLAKPVLEGSDLLEVTWTRLVAGNVGLVGWITLRGLWGEAVVAFRPSTAWKTLVPGAVIGTYLSLVFWLGGFKWADASVAAVLNQMATVYILVLARVLLSETIVPRQVVGAGFAIGGALVILLTR